MAVLGLAGFIRFGQVAGDNQVTQRDKRSNQLLIPTSEQPKEATADNAAGTSVLHVKNNAAENSLIRQHGVQDSDNHRNSNKSLRVTRPKHFVMTAERLPAIVRPDSSFTPDAPTVASSEGAMTPEDEILAQTRLATSQQMSVAEVETFNHIERTQLLLREFRNVRLSRDEAASSLAYERQQSRRLLYNNILLRRNASAAGNLPVAEVLTSVEPLLLDIANLPDRPTPTDVKAIKTRIHNKGIVAALQVHHTTALLASY